MWEDTAVLKGNPQSTYDEYGNEVITYTDTTVYVQSRSVYQQEFYNAAQLGIRPSLVLILSNRMDYNGQKLVEYQNDLYDVVRADWKNGRDSIALTLAIRLQEAPSTASTASTTPSTSSTLPEDDNAGA